MRQLRSIKGTKPEVRREGTQTEPKTVKSAGESVAGGDRRARGGERERARDKSSNLKSLRAEKSSMGDLGGRWRYAEFIRVSAKLL